MVSVFEQDGGAVYVLSDKPFQSLHQAQQHQVRTPHLFMTMIDLCFSAQPTASDPAVHPIFTWHQTEFDIEVRVPIPSNTASHHVDWTLTPHHLALRLGHKGELTRISSGANLFGEFILI